MPTNNNEPLGNDLVLAVELLIDSFAARSIRYALVGGLATLMRGRPRFTQDVDLLVEVPQLALPGLLEELASKGFVLNSQQTIREFVQEHFTSFRYGAVRIDWIKPMLPLYMRTLMDATMLTWSDGHPIRVASPEGLILTKMASFRPQDQIDIETLLIANRTEIQLELIRKEWAAVADSEDVRSKWLEDAIARLAS